MCLSYKEICDKIQEGGRLVHQHVQGNDGEPELDLHIAWGSHEGGSACSLGEVLSLPLSISMSSSIKNGG